MTPPKTTPPKVVTAAELVAERVTPPEPFRVRWAEAEDVPYLRHFQQRAVYRDCGWCPPAGLVNRALAGQLMLVEVNGAPAGFLNFTFRLDQVCHLNQVAIDYDLWRDGYGSHLVSKLIVAAHRRGYRSLTLKCAKESPSNLFWPTLGLQHVADVAGRKRVLEAWVANLRDESCCGIMPPTSAWGQDRSVLFDPAARRTPWPACCVLNWTRNRPTVSSGSSSPPSSPGRV